MSVCERGGVQGRDGKKEELAWPDLLIDRQTELRTDTQILRAVETPDPRASAPRTVIALVVIARTVCFSLLRHRAAESEEKRGGRGGAGGTEARERRAGNVLHNLA